MAMHICHSHREFFQFLILRTHLVLNCALEGPKVTLDQQTIIKEVFKQFLMILLILWCVKIPFCTVARFRSPVEMGPLIQPLQFKVQSSDVLNISLPVRVSIIWHHANNWFLTIFIDTISVWYDFQLWPDLGPLIFRALNLGHLNF